MTDDQCNLLPTEEPMEKIYTLELTRSELLMLHAQLHGHIDHIVNDIAKTFEGKGDEAIQAFYKEMLIECHGILTRITSLLSEITEGEKA
jgi:hypothetical protein